MLMIRLYVVMAIRSPLAPDEFYHLYNRGADKRKIFLAKADYERFVTLLYVANGTQPVRLENIRRSEQGSTLLTRALEVDRGEPLVSIAAYCLMPNHFHLLVRQKKEGGISRFMQKLTTAYTMYFNTKNDRNGTLFQGKFKSEHVGNDRYLKYLLAYIHLNPTKLANLEQYAHSSYADFVGKSRLQRSILDMNVLPEYFPRPKDFKKEMKEWLKFREEITK